MSIIIVDTRTDLGRHLHLVTGVTIARPIIRQTQRKKKIGEGDTVDDPAMEVPAIIHLTDIAEDLVT